jgi:perosamine synthetase
VKIPLSFPDIGEAEIEAVTAVLRSGRLSLGPKLEEFEAAFAAYTGTTHSVGVSSGTAALHLAIRALGIGEGDEVIVPSFAFIAVANVLRYEKATPVFAEIDPLTLNLDPSRIEQEITPRTRAILVVQTFGVPAAMPQILEIARRHRLLVIEDACEALGAELGLRKTGSFGDVGIFGFYPNKQITTGEGGMAVTRSADLAARMRSLRNHGRTTSGKEWDFGEVGYNYRLSELHCALGVEQLRKIEHILRLRTSVAEGYRRRLESIVELQLPVHEVPEGRVSWFVYVVRLPVGAAGRHRDAVIRDLSERGIETGRYFPPIHLQPVFQKFALRPLPVTESAANRTIALPFFTRMTEEQLDTVCTAVRESVRGLA